MKIALLIDSLGSGGAQRQLVNLAGILKECGHEVHFLVYRDRPFFSSALHDFGINETLIESNSSVDLVRKIYSLLRGLDPDYVISFLETPNFLATFASLGKHRWKLVINELSAKKESFISLRCLIKKIFSYKADAIVCNSYNAELLWKSHYPKLSDRLSVIYNPVMFEGELSNNEDVIHNPIRLIVPASYQYLKNPVELVNAVSLLSDCDRAKLSIDWYGRIEVQPGDTRAYDEAAARVIECGLEDCVRLHDATHEIREIMRNADYIGLFSTVEGLPNAICEAMMLGKPVIMTPVSDYEYLLSDSRGVLCAGFKAEQISEGLRKLISMDSADYRRASLSCSSFACREFSRPTISEKWNNLLRDLNDR